MARVRTGGGGSGYAWALVIFGAGFVLCLLLAIVFWVQLGDARQSTAEAQQRLSQFANANEQTRAEFQALATGGQTVVGALAAQNQSLKSMIGGDPQATVEALASRREQVGVGEQQPLLAAIESLQADIASLNQQIADAREQIEAQTARADAAVAAQETQQQAYDASVQALEAQITQLQNDLLAYQGKVDQMVTNANQQIEQVRRTKDNQIAQFQVEVNQLQNERDRLRELLNSITRVDLDEGSRITRPDGEITAVIAEENRVFINRGQNDRIILGMTFEIFERGALIEVADDNIGQQQVRGKATIEVIEVRDSTSLARVVRQAPGANLSVGDQLINLVYDPNATYKFYVYGDFDIDRSGQSQISDRRRIENMITRWGGKLADGVSYDVDYLILGAEPPLPEPLPPGVIDPVRIAQNVEANNNFQTYQELVGKASEMGIPILNQNRFLTLVGYYRR